MSAALSAAVEMLLLLQNPLDEKHLSVQKYRWIRSILENNANPPVVVASVAEASHQNKKTPNALKPLNLNREPCT